jgi:hypothetical protein
MNLPSGDCCDDPWLALERLNDFLAHFVGLSSQLDHAPDATHRGWLRMTQPQADGNHARWPTDPVWELIQRAQFNHTAPLPVQRGKQRAPDLEQIAAELYGLFKLRSVLCERRMDAVDLERDYYEGVRQKARMMGKSVPAQQR